MTMFHPPEHGYFSLSVVEGKRESVCPRLLLRGGSSRLGWIRAVSGATHNLLCDSRRSDVPDVLCGNGSGSSRVESAQVLQIRAQSSNLLQ